MTSREDARLARKLDAEKAALAYGRGHTLMEVADELGVSYGKARALALEGGAKIRPRGARFVLPTDSSS